MSLKDTIKDMVTEILQYGEHYIKRRDGHVQRYHISPAVFKEHYIKSTPHRPLSAARKFGKRVRIYERVEPPVEPPVKPPIEPPVEPPVTVYRIQIAREYYSTDPGRNTPEPFAEYRTWIYSTHPDEYSESEMGKWLNELEWAISITAGRLHINWSVVVYNTQNYENRKIDWDEVDAPLDDPQYHLIFYRDQAEYTTEVVKELLLRAGARTYMPKTIRERGLDEWRRRPKPSRKRRPR